MLKVIFVYDCMKNEKVRKKERRKAYKEAAPLILRSATTVVVSATSPWEIQFFSDPKLRQVM